MKGKFILIMELWKEQYIIYERPYQIKQKEEKVCNVFEQIWTKDFSIGASIHRNILWIIDKTISKKGVTVIICEHQSSVVGKKMF